MNSPNTIYVIACGALAREMSTIKQLNHWDHMVVDYLPASLHNTPTMIPQAVRSKLLRAREKYDVLFVAYADCGTGGRLDKMLEELQVERLPGAHCYQFFAGNRFFLQLAEQEPGSFYLTDFLALHFERLVLRGLGIDRHPELQSLYFGNYKKLVYLTQVEDPRCLARARQAARILGLVFEQYRTGYGELLDALENIATRGVICPS